MKECIIAMLCLCLGVQVLSAQTNTWAGTTNNQWSTATNWSLGLTPIAAHDVVIPSGTPNSPQVNVDAFCQSVVVDNGATLTVNATFELYIDGMTTVWNGLELDGTLVNNGRITILNITLRGLTMSSTATFTNNFRIHITGSFYYGLGNNGGTVNNQNGAYITVINTTNEGIYNIGATANFTNAGDIICSNTGADAIQSDNGATFTNTTTGEINVFDVGEDGVQNSINSTFNNDGELVIGLNIGRYGIINFNNSTFNNNATGLIIIDTGDDEGIITYLNNATFNNYSTINIYECQYGITCRSTGIFNNFSGGDINLNDLDFYGILLWFGEFNNSADITVNTSDYYGIEVQYNTAGTFTNNSTGNIDLNNVTGGVSTTSASALFINNGNLDIDLAAGSAVMSLSGTNASPTFINNPSGNLIASGNIFGGSAFVSNGDIFPGSSTDVGGLLFSGNPILGNTNILDCNVAGTAGVNTVGGHDYISVSGGTVINGTLDVSYLGGFMPSIGDSFLVVASSGGSYTGTFDTVNLPPPPAGSSWDVQYNTNDVTLVLVAPCTTDKAFIR